MTFAAILLRGCQPFLYRWACPITSRDDPLHPSGATHMIERVYGTLIEGAGAGIMSRLDAFDALDGQAAEAFGPLSGHR